MIGYDHVVGTPVVGTPIVETPIVETPNLGVSTTL